MPETISETDNVRTEEAERNEGIEVLPEVSMNAAQFNQLMTTLNALTTSLAGRPAANQQHKQQLGPS